MALTVLWQEKAHRVFNNDDRVYYVVVPEDIPPGALLVLQHPEGGESAFAVFGGGDWEAGAASIGSALTKSSRVGER